MGAGRGTGMGLQFPFDPSRGFPGEGPGQARVALLLDDDRSLETLDSIDTRESFFLLATDPCAAEFVPKVTRWTVKPCPRRVVVPSRRLHTAAVCESRSLLHRAVPSPVKLDEGGGTGKVCC